MELQVFQNNQFGSIRTMYDEHVNIFLCGNDVAKALGYRNPRDALAKHCVEDGVAFCDVIDAVGRKQSAKFINEGNMYRLILRSNLPTARAFEKWVMETVLPTIRKTGIYCTSQAMKQLTDQIAALQPKAAYYDALVEQNVLTGIRQTAKELRIPEKLFTYLLVEMRFVYRTPKKQLMPYAFMVNNGFVELKEYTTGKHGGVYMLFTPIGRLYLMRRIDQRLAIQNTTEEKEYETDHNR